MSLITTGRSPHTHSGWSDWGPKEQDSIIVPLWMYSRFCRICSYIRWHHSSWWKSQSSKDPCASVPIVLPKEAKWLISLQGLFFPIYLQGDYWVYFQYPQIGFLAFFFLSAYLNLCGVNHSSTTVCGIHLERASKCDKNLPVLLILIIIKNSRKKSLFSKTVSPEDKIDKP